MELSYPGQLKGAIMGLYQITPLVLAAILTQCNQCTKQQDADAAPTSGEINRSLHAVWDNAAINYPNLLGSEDTSKVVQFALASKLRDGIRKHSANGEVWVGEVRLQWRVSRQIAYNCMIYNPDFEVGLNFDGHIEWPVVGPVLIAKKGELATCDRQMTFERVKEGWMPPDGADDDRFLIKRAVPG